MNAALKQNQTSSEIDRIGSIYIEETDVVGVSTRDLTADEQAELQYQIYYGQHPSVSMMACSARYDWPTALETYDRLREQFSGMHLVAHCADLSVVLTVEDKAA